MSKRLVMNGQKPNKCPTCHKLGAWMAGLYGPFCSRRCKLIDLGKWLGEENAISSPLRDEHLLESDGYSQHPSVGVREDRNT